MPAPKDWNLPTTTRMATVSERAAQGKAARKDHPRSALGQWAPHSDRPDVVSMVLSQEVNRVPELLPIRHARMAVSPFAFYRGGASVMAYDLGTYSNSGIVSQLCGDAHLSNFGVFGSPDRSMIFDVNDFDETHPGSFEWDVARMVASFFIAAQENKFTQDDSQSITRIAAQTYRESMAQYATMNDLDQWYSRVDAQYLLTLAGTEGGVKATKNMTRTLDKARSRDRWSAISKLTEVVDGKRQFMNQPPLLARLPMTGDVWKMVITQFEQYRQSMLDDRRELLRRYHVIDFAHKVVGVGSVGLRAFVVLLQGRDEDDLLVLQVKEAVASALSPYTGGPLFTDEGHRVVAGQRMMQAASDVFLGYITGVGGRHFYIRQLRDMKWSPIISNLTPKGMTGYAQLCGKSLARGHARSGDSVKIAGYIGSSDTFDTSLVDFSQRYATQVHQDFAEFTQAIADGHVATTMSEVSAVDSSLQVETQKAGEAYTQLEAMKVKG